MISKSGEYLIGIEENVDLNLTIRVQFYEYAFILIHNGEGIYHADFSSFLFTGPKLLFATPMQTIFFTSEKEIKYTLLRFHSDFYCIEAHRDEVACNGLLFNNIYAEPSVDLSKKQLQEFSQLINQIKFEFKDVASSEIVLKAYLQVFLAKCSSIKLKTLEILNVNTLKDDKMEQFRLLLDKNFLTLHKPNDYAELLLITSNTLSKKSIKYFGKTPSQLIQDRLVLEAKKLLHLTTFSIKEIAFRLQFNDEYYFSRFFKKCTKLSPQTFRKKGGISEIAYLSKE
ncbi:helix-turn-helix domain-containing protein [Halpernia frigidisoli]|nr:helix-turn-helix transcriptional regulator [Halpernia frigidisoli]